MMANAGVIQETLTGRTDALEPTPFNTTSADAIVERRLHAVTPELATQVDIETRLLDNLVALKAASIYSRQISAGEPLAADPMEIRDNFIIPEYQAQLPVYREELFTGVTTRLPELQNRLRMAENLLAQNPPYLQNSRPRLEKDVDWLKKDIANAQLTVRTKEVMYAQVDTFLKNSSPDEISEKVGAISHAAKKIALQQAIISLDAQRSTLAYNDSKDAKLIHTLDMKVSALRNELSALDDIERFDGSVDSTVSPVESAQPRPVERIETRQSKISTGLKRMLGSFGLTAVSFR